MKNRTTAWQEQKFCRRYRRSVRISTEDVHYGYLAPGEKELKLLGSHRSLKGKKIIEVGCGAAQNSIALTKWGAHCTRVDISKSMLTAARTLTKKERVTVKLIEGNAVNLLTLLGHRNGHFDIAISSYAIGFVPNAGRVLEQISLCLRPDGKFVFCITHPCQKPTRVNSLSIPEDNLSGWKENYFTINQMTDLLSATGFLVERIVEQTTRNPSRLTAEERSEYPYEPLHIAPLFDGATLKPHTIIYVCRKINSPKKP